MYYSICILFALTQGTRLSSAFLAPTSPELRTRGSSASRSPLNVNVLSIREISSSRPSPSCSRIRTPTHSILFSTGGDEESDAHVGKDGSSSRPRRRNMTGMNDENDDTETDVIPCLPPIGESSFTGETTHQNGEVIRLDGTSHDVCHVGSERFELQYTCNICETRNSHKVSRMAYRNGIVITVCKGCMAKHLIADNLGWTKYLGGFNGDKNIEEFMESMGRKDEVNRVSQEVFDLEQILNVHDDNDVGALKIDDTNAFE